MQVEAKILGALGMRHCIVGFVAAAAWAIAASLSTAAALVDTGKAVGVDPSAFAQGAGAARNLVVGADVALGERVTTGRTGQVQLIFYDDTHLVVGPNSSLVIEDYLLRKDQSVGKFTISALAGTFRFITGKSPKDAYDIKTPTGTIGVRGTAFDFIASKAATKVVLFHGMVRLCSIAGKCVELTGRCEVGVYDTSNSAILGLARQSEQDLRSQFRYVRSEKPLLQPFKVDRATACLRPIGGPGGSLASPGGACVATRGSSCK
jgi:hypothetical protein